MNEEENKKSGRHHRRHHRHRRSKPTPDLSTDTIAEIIAEATTGDVFVASEVISQSTSEPNAIVESSNTIDIVGTEAMARIEAIPAVVSEAEAEPGATDNEGIHGSTDLSDNYLLKRRSRRRAINLSNDSDEISWLVTITDNFLSLLVLVFMVCAYLVVIWPWQLYHQCRQQRQEDLLDGEVAVTTTKTD